MPLSPLLTKELGQVRTLRLGLQAELFAGSGRAIMRIAWQVGGCAHAGCPHKAAHLKELSHQERAKSGKIGWPVATCWAEPLTFGVPCCQSPHEIRGRALPTLFSGADHSST